MPALVTAYVVDDVLGACPDHEVRVVRGDDAGQVLLGRARDQDHRTAGFEGSQIGDHEVDGAGAGEHDQPADLLPGSSEERTSELQALMRISYAVFCLQKITQ